MSKKKAAPQKKTKEDYRREVKKILTDLKEKNKEKQRKEYGNAES